MCHLFYFAADISRCKQLSFLQLQHNELTELPSSVGELSNLKRLGVQYNKLSELPVSLCQCTELTEIGVESNVLTSLPVSILVAEIVALLSRVNSFFLGVVGVVQYYCSIIMFMSSNS